jgi:hypothetical protein
VPYRDGCRGPAIFAAVLALPGYHPHVCALRLLLVISLWLGWPLAYKKFRIRLKVFQNQPFVIGMYPFERIALIPPTDDYAQRLSAAIPFPKTILGNRQHGAWQRLISVIKSSETLSAFDKAAAYIEGYAHALIDSDQIDISIERDVLIIEIVDAWRCARVGSSTSTYL